MAKKGKASNKTEMLCNECNHTFKRVIGKNTFEVRCPKCKGYDTEPSGYILVVNPLRTNTRG